MKRLFIYILLFSLQGLSHAQTDSTLTRLSAFVKNIQTFNHLYPQEKVYLHFDNTGYFLGETIWFKAYVTLASNLQSTPLNRVLYVELLDIDGNVTSTQKLRIENGQANGGLSLNKLGMKSGFYEVRAYTRSMLNWSTDNLYSRVFPVFDVPDKDGDYSRKKIRLRPPSLKIPFKREKTSSAKKVTLDLLPEGGHLVKGVTSTVAFKLTDKDGRPLEADGFVCSIKGDTISTFSTLHDGMGSFLYTPNDGARDKVWILCREDNKKYDFVMPEAEAAGCVMQVQNLHPDLLRVTISSTPSFISAVSLGLTVTCRGKVGYFKVLNSSDTQVLDVPKSELSSGVNQLTLFTADGKIIAERLVYIHGSEPLSISVWQDKTEYRPFEQVRMEFSVEDVAGDPVETTFSLAIRDKQAEIPTSYQDNIYTNLLLSSDLKGYIENPGYYFESKDRTHRMALDLLMLTQGYRRYSWEQMAGITSFEASYPTEKGILVDGTVKSIVRKTTREDIDVKIIMYSDSGYQQALCPTDSVGRFNYLASDFYGKWNLQLESKKKNKRKEYWITLERGFSPQGRSYSFYDTYIPEMKSNRSKTQFMLTKEKINQELPDDTPELDSLASNVRLLKELEVKARRSWLDWGESVNIVYNVEEEADQLEDQMKGYNEMLFEFLARINPYFHYDLDSSNDLGYNPDLTNYSGSSKKEMKERGFAYKTRYKGRKAYFYLIEEVPDIPSQYAASEKPGIAILEADNFKEEDIGDIKEFSKINFSTLSSTDVSLITIMEYPGSVLIGVKMHTNNIAKNREPIGVRLTSLQGFSIPRVFYSPNYGEFKLPDEPDFRRTLYWNPNVETNPQGKATVNFYNNASCREMDVSAETITGEGIPGYYDEK